MAGQTITLIDALLKDFYLGKIQDQLNNETLLYKDLRKSNRPWEGRAVVFPVKIGRNASSASVGIGDALPTADRQRYAESRISAKYHYAKIQIDGQSLAAARTNKGAFANALTSEIEGAVTDFTNEQNRQFFGDGTGQLADVDAAYLGGVNPVTITTVSAAEPGARFLRIGQTIDFYTAGVLNVTTSITDVDTSVVPNTITVAAPAGIIAADTIHIHNSRNNEIDGLRAMTSSTNTYQNIDRTIGANREWRGNRVDFGAALTEVLMQQAFDLASERGNGKIKRIYAHYATRRSYFSTLQTEKRYLEANLLGGSKKLDFNGVDFSFEKDCPYRTIFFLDNSQIQCYEQEKMHWDDTDGNILQRVLNPSEIDAYSARLKGYWNVGSTRPSASVEAFNTL